MPLEQTFTIFRTESVKMRTANGGLRPDTLVSHYPGFGRTASAALDDVMQDVAENESPSVADIPMDDPDYDSELAMAVENLSGTWEVFAGTHRTRPAGAPLARA